MARLMQSAGHRPEVPEWDHAVVKAAARKAWRRKVGQRSRRRFYLAGGGLLAAAAALVVVISPLLRSAPGVATFEALAGSVTVFATDSDATAGSVGSPVRRGRTVETGETGRAALRLAGGSSLRLDRATRLVLASASELVLERGTIYVDSGLSTPGPSEALEVRTPMGVARDIGTQFEVRSAADAVRVRVREGEVALERGDESHRAVAGEELTWAAGGSVVRSQVPLSGDPWDWTLDIVPAFDTAERTLHDLLVWAAREGGFELAFADPEIERSASAIELQGYGRIEGASLREGLDLVFLGTRLVYRIDGDRLLVDGL